MANRQEEQPALLAHEVDRFIEAIPTTEALGSDKRLMAAAVERDGFLLKYASISLQNDVDVVTVAVKQNGRALQCASTRMKDDHDTVKVAVNNNGIALQYASNRLQDDPDIVKTAVSNNGIALRYTSKRLRYNDYIVKKAIEQNYHAYEFAPVRFRNQERPNMSEEDPRFVQALNFVQEKTDLPRFRLRFLVEYVSREFADNEQIVLAAVQSNALCLRSASESLRGNYDIVMAAVRNDGIALQYASELLKDNYDIVMAAVRNVGYALQYASDSLRDNYDIVSVVVRGQYGVEALHFCSVNLAENVELASVVIRNTTSWFFSFYPPLSSGIAKALRKVTKKLVDLELAWGTTFHFQEQGVNLGAGQLRRRNELALLSVTRNGFPRDCVKLLQSFLSDEFCLVVEVSRLAPILEAFTTRGFDWRKFARDLDSSKLDEWRELARGSSLWNNMSTT